MPVYTLNPSHRRGARKASHTSLRERVAGRRSNPNVMGNAIIWTPAGEGALEGEILVSRDGGRRTTAPYAAYVRRTSDGYKWSVIGWADREPLAEGRATSLLAAQKAVGNVAIPTLSKNPRRSNPNVMGNAIIWTPAGEGVLEGEILVSRDGGRRTTAPYAAYIRRTSDGYGWMVIGLADREPLAKGRATSLLAAQKAVGNVAIPSLSKNPRRAASARRRNPLSEDGAVVSNPRSVKGSGYLPGRSTGMYNVVAIHGGTDWAVMDATQTAVKRGFAMTHAEAVSLARRNAERDRAQGHATRWYDMSSHHGEKSNPLSEDGAVVSNPRAKVVKAKKPVAKKRGSKRSGGRTVAQSNAAKAMKLFHSGRASSLGEAWEMVRGGR